MRNIPNAIFRDFKDQKLNELGMCICINNKYSHLLVLAYS